MFSHHYNQTHEASQFFKICLSQKKKKRKKKKKKKKKREEVIFHQNK
jgi:hypothetical protein